MGACGSSIEDKLDMLLLSPFFIMPRDDLISFAEFFRIRSFKQGEVIVKEGSKLDAFHVIGDGGIDMTASDGITDAFLGSKRTGDFFGRRSVVGENEDSLITLTTTMPTVTLSLDRRQFERFVLKYPELQSKVEDIMGVGMENLLKRSDFLAKLDDKKLSLLSSLLQYMPVKSGEVIFRQGDIGHEMFFIANGFMQVRAAGDNGFDKKVADLDEGSYFGEISLMNNIPRTATVIAMVDSLLLSLHKEDFKRFLHLAQDSEAQFQKVAKERTTQLLKKFQIACFDPFPDYIFPDLADACDIQTVPPKTCLFKAGDDANKFYVMIYGQMKATIPKQDGKTEDIILNPGQYFGEVSLVKPVKRNATVTSISRCVLLSFTRERFHKIFEQNISIKAEFELRLVKEEASLSAVLNHPLGLDFFTKQLKREFSEENINFWKAATNWRRRLDEHRGTRPMHTPQKSSATVIDDIKEESSLIEEADSGEAQLEVVSGELSSEDIRLSELSGIPTELKQEAEEIVKRFVSASGDEQVNLNSQQLKILENHIQTRNFFAAMFEDAVKEIEHLMRKDSFERFKKTELFQDLLRSVAESRRDERGDSLSPGVARTRSATLSANRRKSKGDRRLSLNSMTRKNIGSKII